MIPQLSHLLHLRSQDSGFDSLRPLVLFFSSLVRYAMPYEFTLLELMALAFRRYVNIASL
jgi:hypothetical protein